MPDKCDMRWFKQNFHEKIDAAIQGTPFTLDLMTALACQETGDVWPILRKKNLTLDRVLELCVGDTLDFPKRKAFPRNRAALEAQPNGPEMFALAHQSLVEMAQFVPGFPAGNPNKFCHGYGIFQLDLQFFKETPDFFLQKDFADFDKCLGRALGELQSARTKIGLGNQNTLSDLELVHVAIAYNTGTFKPELGLKQGHKSDDGKFYGEQVFAFLKAAHDVRLADSTTALPFTVDASGPRFKVNSTKLNLRSEPCVDSGPASNIKAKLENGHEVRALTNQAIGDNLFLEVETTVGSGQLRGFASFQLLTPA